MLFTAMGELAESFCLQGVELRLRNRSSVEHGFRLRDLVCRRPRSGNLLHIVRKLLLHRRRMLGLALGHAAAACNQVDQHRQERQEDECNYPHRLGEATDVMAAEQIHKDLEQDDEPHHHDEDNKTGPEQFAQTNSRECHNVLQDWFDNGCASLHMPQIPFRYASLPRMRAWQPAGCEHLRMTDPAFPQATDAAETGSDDDQDITAEPKRMPVVKIIWALIRAIVSVGLVTWCYIAFDASRGSTSGVLALILGLTVFLGYTAWQGRRIVRARYPQLRAIETLATLIPLFLFVFAATYLRISLSDSSAFSEVLHKGSALYFTIVVFSTTGFGDIVPRSGVARAIVNTQMLIDLFLIGTILRFLFKAVDVGRTRRSTVTNTAPSTDAAAQSGQGVQQ